jgi:hypothetical protein
MTAEDAITTIALPLTGKILSSLRDAPATRQAFLAENATLSFAAKLLITSALEVWDGGEAALLAEYWSEIPAD